MEETLRAIRWEAPEHTHIEKSSDWYWMLSIIAFAGAVASIIFGNILLSLVIILGAMCMVVVSHRMPRILQFEISPRGIRVESEFHPYTTLDAYFIDEENIGGPQLIVRSKKFFEPLLIIPLPEEYIDDVEDIIGPRLIEEHLEEPFSHRLLEFFGF